jgi:uncharacterized membrane protein YkoI
VNRTKLIAGGALALALTASGTGLAVAAAERRDPAVPAEKADQARAAALQHTGGGRVIATEAGDDGAAYGVEIRLPDGSVVEVALDGGFGVIGTEADDG